MGSGERSSSSPCCGNWFPMFSSSLLPGCPRAFLLCDPANHHWRHQTQATPGAGKRRRTPHLRGIPTKKIHRKPTRNQTTRTRRTTPNRGSDEPNHARESAEETPTARAPKNNQGDRSQAHCWLAKLPLATHLHHACSALPAPRLARARARLLAHPPAPLRPSTAMIGTTTARASAASRERAWQAPRAQRCVEQRRTRLTKWTEEGDGAA